MNQVVIMRGLPGSGKSYYADKLSKQNASIICSADSFFETIVLTTDALIGSYTGMFQTEYHFDATKLPVAHAKCFSNFLNALKAQYKHIIVDNTNIHKWEYQNYEAAASLAGYSVQIVEFRAITIEDIKICIRRNTHNVPSNVIANMAVEFEYDTRASMMAIEC
jgi:predicted kinase